MSHHGHHGRELSHAAQGAFVVLAILFAALMFGVGVYVGQNSEPEGEGHGTAVATSDTLGEEEGDETEPAETEEEPAETEEEPAETEEEPAEGGGADGEAIFASAGCGSCHVLEEAGSSGTIGPNLDDSTMDREAVEQQIREGGGGMPPFEGQLSDEEIEALSDFVVEAQG